MTFKLLREGLGKEDIQRGPGTSGSHRATDVECITYQGES